MNAQQTESQTRKEKMKKKLDECFIDSIENKNKINFINFIIWLAISIITTICYWFNYKPDIILGIIAYAFSFYPIYIMLTIFYLTKFLYNKKILEKKRLSL